MAKNKRIWEKLPDKTGMISFVPGKEEESGIREIKFGQKQKMTVVGEVNPEGSDSRSRAKSIVSDYVKEEDRNRSYRRERKFKRARIIR